MKPSPALLRWAALASLQSLVAALTIAEINGNKFLSPYSGQTVTNVTGLVIAKGPNGIFIRSTTPDKDIATSEALYVFDKTVGANITVGDIISLDGKILEYRNNNAYLYLTELTTPKNVQVLSSGNKVKPLVIGKDTVSPPSEQFSSLDGGDIYNVPNGAANISAVNPVLQPKKFGLDFWESLSGELVTVRKPSAIKQPNNYGDTWVIGDWKASGRNKNGGLTMSAKDSNPEAIIIGTPLDGTKNPNTSKMGDVFEDITGVVQNTFGFYYILPLTAVKVSAPSKSVQKPTTLKRAGNCKAVTVGSYNVENLAPTSAHMSKVADHIVTYLKNPDLIFVQEVQDNSGPTNDGTVDANVTLSTLAAAIKTAGGVTYDFAEVVPAPGNLDGGQPGGNIRQAYLYRPDMISLYKPNQGSGTDATAVVPGNGKGAAPSLSFNPGRIEPASSAWTSSRKPIAAAWIVKGATKPFYTVNVHFSSKGGGTSLHGDIRPPVNGGIESRVQQANVTASFIAQILAQDPKAAVISAGDFNEFAFVQPLTTFTSISKMKDMDEVAKIKVEERYTYAFDMNAQALDHMFVSPSLAADRKSDFEHLHVNTWSTYADMVSDHDPSVALFDLCG
ncbi:Endonuclease/exonuclease/phosphatase [Podospora australis]|uniref:Endonuclease/exonuclease/phosphatase n=1 Tax=Podospora australis TaxID=1536484 RepID=A0AAN7AHC0_9PEZI|nr:Endonuclease/exonuclease/phosphatase [Podospora australis]